MNFRTILYSIVVLAGALWVTGCAVDMVLVLRERFVIPSFEKGLPSNPPESSKDFELPLQKGKPSGAQRLDTVPNLGIVVMSSVASASGFSASNGSLSLW